MPSTASPKNESNLMMGSVTRSPKNGAFNGAFTNSETNNTDPKTSVLIRKKLSQVSTNPLITQKSHVIKSKPIIHVSSSDSLPFEYV